MLKIRMQRIGRRHDPHFRIIVTDGRRGPKSGKFIELLGSYNAKLGDVQLKADRIQYWLSVGAQASGTVHNFLVDQKVIKADKKNVLPKKTRIVKEQPEEEKKEAPKEETPAVTEEAPSEPEAPTEEPKEETPTEEPKEDEQPEEKKEAAPEEPKEE